MDKLTHWYKHKELDKALDTESQDIWFQKISFIPNGVFHELVDQITDTEKFMPTPNQVKLAYGDYKKIHPEKFIRHEQDIEDCDYCLSTGYIEAWRMWGQYSYCYVIPCGHCENWKRFFPSKATPMSVREIEQSGFTLIDPQAREATAENEYTNITEMAQAVGQDIPEDDIPF